MANLDPLKIDTFVRITRTEEAYAVHKPLQHEGDLNAALDAHYRLTDTNIYIPDSEDNLIDIDVQENTFPREYHTAASRRPNSLADDLNPIDCVEVPVFLLRDIDDFEEEIEEAEDALDEYRQSHLQDPFLAHAISLSLETAEIEKQLRETASMIEKSRCGVSEAPNVEQRQMKSSSSSVEAGNTSYQNKPNDEENESRGVPAASLIDDSAFDEWLTLYEAAMIAEIPDSRYRSGSLAPRTPSPSAEAQRLIREKQDEEYYESLQADREKALREVEACQLEIQAARNAEHRKIEEEQEVEKQLAEKEASLPLEPAIDEENAVTILILMPSGNRLTRCFMESHNLQTLFDFIDISRLIKPNTYRLVKPFPRETSGAEQSCLTLQELGLINKHEAFFLTHRLKHRNSNLL